MGRFETWLRREAGGFSVFGYSFGWLILDLAYSLAFVYLVGLLKVLPSREEVGDLYSELMSHSLLFVFAAFVYWALIEELLFRLPICLPVRTGDKLSLIMFFALILSIFFGLAHGHIIFIFNQGIMGFMYCILFLKCGGMNKKVVKPLIVTTLTHASYNFSLFLLFRFLAR